MVQNCSYFRRGSKQVELIHMGRQTGTFPRIDINLTLKYMEKHYSGTKIIKKVCNFQETKIWLVKELELCDRDIACN